MPNEEKTIVVDWIGWVERPPRGGRDPWFGNPCEWNETVDYEKKNHDVSTKQGADLVAGVGRVGAERDGPRRVERRVPRGAAARHPLRPVPRPHRPGASLPRPLLQRRSRFVKPTTKPTTKPTYQPPNPPTNPLTNSLTNPLTKQVTNQQTHQQTH